MAVMDGRASYETLLRNTWSQLLREKFLQLGAAKLAPNGSALHELKKVKLPM